MILTKNKKKDYGPQQSVIELENYILVQEVTQEVARAP